MSQLRIVCVLGALALAPAAPVGADDDSIFTRPGPPAATPPVDAGDADLAALQLTGISTLGGQSMFNFVDTRSNRSFWVSLHGTAHGVTVRSFDAAADTVVVDRAGRTRPVKLRQAKIGVIAPAAPAVAAAPAPVRVPSGMPAGPVVRTADGSEIANPKTPQEIAQAETEARMLVSDLLEISMQERARQRALREQQQGGGAPPAPTPTGR